MTAVTPGSRLPALVAYVFRACLPAKRLGVLALPILAAPLAGLLATTLEGSGADTFSDLAIGMIFGLVLPLGTLVIGDAVLGAEVRSGTLSFTWLTPTRFWELVVGRWLGGVAIAALTLVPASALAAVIGGAPDHVVPVAAAMFAASAAHIALFVLVGCLTRRAAVWSLAIVFVVERLLGAALAGVAQLSPTWLGSQAYVGLAGDIDQHLRDGVPAGGAAIGRLVVLVVVFLVGATWGVRRLSLTGSRD